MVETAIINLMKRSKLFQGLKDREIENISLFTVPVEKKFLKNQMIVNQGELVDQIGVLKKGTAVSMKYHRNGNVQILRTYNQGEAFSLDAVNTTILTSPVSILSRTDSIVIFFPYIKILKSDYISAHAKNRILANSSEILSNELIRLMYKIDVLSKRTLRERILTYLSLMSEKSCSGTFNIDMNQEQLAQYLCVNRSVLSKELNRMRKCGLINYKGKRFTLFE